MTDRDTSTPTGPQPKARHAWPGPAVVTSVLAVAAIVAATIAAYEPGTHAPFYLDDTRIIVDDATLRWDEVSWQRAAETLEHATLPTRPVANLSLAVNHALGGLDPTGYHWTNIVIHLGVGGALAWLAFLIASAGGAERRWSLLAALTATGCFLLHPLNIQAVTYVVQRMASLAALFSLLAIALYVSARAGHARTRRARVATFAGAAASWALALGSKENAVTALPVVVAYEWCFHGDVWRQRTTAAWRRGTAAKVLLVGLPALAIAALVPVALAVLEWGSLPGRDFSGLERVLTQARVQGWYLSVVAWPAPSRLSIEHELDPSRSLFDPWTTLPAVVCIAAAVAVLGWLVWRRRRPRLVWPLVAYLVFHSVESAPVSLELVFEHRMYLPMAALAVALACALADLAPRHRLVALSACGVLACSLAVATHQRNRVWADELAFWQHTVQSAPRLPRAHASLGHCYARQGRYAEAAGAFEKSLALQPTSTAHYNLGNVLYLHLDRRAEAIQHLRAATSLAPRYASPRSMLGMIAERAGDLDEARRELEVVAQLEPTDPSARANLGRVYLRQGRYAQAITELEAANRFGVKVAGAYNNLGIAYTKVGRTADAVEAFGHALRLDPTSEAATANLRMLTSGAAGTPSMQRATANP